MFERLLVANRGEVARRIIATAHRMGIETVLVCAGPDLDSLAAQEASQVVPLEGVDSRATYLNEEVILAAAERYGCQAVHPGYGFLSESARFAWRCALAHLTFLGPSPGLLHVLGDKVQARHFMAARGLPTLPASGLLFALDDALRAAASLGYPVMLKAVSSGGGRGIRRCETPAALGEHFAAAEREQSGAFAVHGFYVERAVPGARHVEWQLLSDAYGRVVVVGDRESSLQRGFQKVLEEAPSPCLGEAERDACRAMVARAWEGLGYCGVATLEMLRDAEGRLYFLEVNPRLQVEHTVTELCTGIDLVAWQIGLALGQPLSLPEVVPHRGAALQCRLNAEDPRAAFRPCPGALEVVAPEGWASPWAHPVRLDSAVLAAGTVPPFYDPMFAKLCVWGADRRRAVAAMGEALAALEIRGVTTNLALQRALVASEGVATGRYDTAFLEAFVAAWGGSAGEG